MVVKTGVMGSSEPALVFPVVASLCSLQGIQTLKTNKQLVSYLIFCFNSGNFSHCQNVVERGCFLYALLHH